MGTRERDFSEPKYEINLEAKDKVLIRQEKKNPIVSLLKKIFNITIITLATLFLSGIVFNMVSRFFYPARVVVSFTHNANQDQLTTEELAGIKIYMDGRKSAISTRQLTNGLSFKFRKKGQHIIGIENRNSRFDSLNFVREKQLLDSLGLFKKKHYSNRTLANFAFHKLISDQDIKKDRFLSFVTRQTESHRPRLMFLSYPNQSSLIVDEVSPGSDVPNDAPLLRNFQGALYRELTRFSANVDVLTAQQRQTWENDYDIRFSAFNKLNWFSEDNRAPRFKYAKEMNKRLKSSVFLVPHVMLDGNGSAFAKLVLAFADIGVLQIEPIEIRNINLAQPRNMSIFSIIQAYLSLYDSFLYDGEIDASIVNAFISICNEAPNTDRIARIGNRIVRTTSAMPQATSIVNTLDDFFARIENMQCIALYNELADFWMNDPYNLRAISQFNMQEREVVRAIIKWSLALKENEHKCAENDWPTNQQRLSLFTTIKNVIDNTSSLTWLQDDALYGVLIIEINKLNNSQ